MSRSHYSMENAQPHSVRGNAKLRGASRARYGGDWHSVPHTHNHLELFYIVGGKGQFLIEDQLYPVDTSQLVVINPNVLHTEVSLNSQPLEYIVLGVDGIELSIGNGNGQFCVLTPSEGAEISSCLRNILREMELKSTGYEDVCQAFMEILIIRLMRSISLSAPTESHTSTTNHQCAAIRRYIDQHFKEALTLDQLAEDSHMNKFYLSHAFKRQYGVSPINYMISRRLEESKYLLAETDLSMSQIAQLLGFSSSSYFSQLFSKTQSMTPREYRQQTRKSNTAL